MCCLGFTELLSYERRCQEAAVSSIYKAERKQTGKASPKETGFAASYFTFSVRYWFGMGRNITTK